MADVILLPSEAARLEFIARGHAAERLRVMNYAVDERFFAERPEDVVNRFLVVGNLTHQKGADLLVEALRKGVLRGHEVRVIGRDVGPTTQFARTLSELGAAVQPPGRQDSLLSLYAASTWLILSSRREGFGLVVLESMAAGCIPLVSRGAGAADVAAEIDPRLTFPPTLDGLVAAVEWARGLSFEEVAHLSSMSVSVARNRTWAAYADTCDQTYASLFDDARFRGR